MNFLNGILEGSTEHAIVALDDRGTFLHFNRGAQLLFGHDSAGLIHSRPFDLLIDLERAPYPSLPALLEEIDRRGVLVAELPMLTRDGRRLTALLTMNRLSAPAANNLTYVAIMRDISEQKEMEELLKLYTENLQQLVEQKTRELDRQHMQLIQSSKLATLGEMATGIAHELNQPLSGIRTRAQLVQKSLERDPYDLDRVRHSQHEIIELVDRISHIIHHMRIFARQDQQHYAPFDIRQSVQGALSLLGEQLRIHNIDVRTELPDEPAPVNGEPLQIEQVILNLVSNARDAMDGRHESARRQGEGASYHKRLLIALDQPDPGQVRLRVADNGTGIPADQLGRIFDPFFTTKPVGRGTGLGLSISYGIISNHGGRIEVESNAGQGTVFHLLLPVHLEAEASVGADDQGELDL